jgi:hypothetical protein
LKKTVAEATQVAKKGKAVKATPMKAARAITVAKREKEATAVVVKKERKEATIAARKRLALHKNKVMAATWTKGRNEKVDGTNCELEMVFF